MQPADPPCERLLLHSHSLQFFHPARRQTLLLTAAPPPHFVEQAEALGLARAGQALEQLVPSGATWLGEAGEEQVEDDYDRLIKSID